MQEYRLVMQYKNQQGKFINNEIIVSGEIKIPKEIIDLGLRHSEQIEILQRIQDNLLNKQSEYLKEDINYCPKCGNKLHKNGINKCSFNAIFTDHKVPVYRQLCVNCNWSSVPSINSLFGCHMHPDLIKIQCEEASRQSYSKAKYSLNLKSCKNRKVNSTMTIHGVVEAVGNYISQNPDEDISKSEQATILVVQVDGGHIKSKDKDSRSFEALTSVIYKPENVVVQGKKERGVILNKHCAASSLNDQQDQIKKLTLLAAKKEGMTNNTELIAISDGAANCWNVIDHLKAHCKSITSILDWFHIAMKFQNIGGLKSDQSDKLLESAKWSLWHGNTKLFYERINELIEQVSNAVPLKKLQALKQYISNNESKIIDYDARKNQNLIFTSNLAECTVESLINQRCKGKQHMQWSREGVQPILQIRAASASNDWQLNWGKYILGAFQKAA
jgi:hypothetical protein